MRSTYSVNGILLPGMGWPGRIRLVRPINSSDPKTSQDRFEITCEVGEIIRNFDLSS